MSEDQMMDWKKVTVTNPDGSSYSVESETKGHPNAAILMEIAKEAAVNHEYWKEFQWQDCDGVWFISINQTSLLSAINQNIKIRRKPRTIRIGNYDVPEPMREHPENNSYYFLVDLIEGRVFSYQWVGHEKQWINNGLVQQTKEGAELMLKALQELLGAKQ